MELSKTKEWVEIFDYIKNVLRNEFPTSEFTIEYLILSILDNPKSHANIIMDGVLMSESMDYLRQYFNDEIKLKDKKPIIKKEITFDKDLSDLIACSVEEAVQCNANKLGTEHILLALLNKIIAKYN